MTELRRRLSILASWSECLIVIIMQIIHFLDRQHIQVGCNGTTEGHLHCLCEEDPNQCPYCPSGRSIIHYIHLIVDESFI